MKKLLISISIAFLLSYGLGGRNAFAQKVDKYKAEGIAVRYFEKHTHTKVNKVVIYEQSNELYTFNFNDNGFVMMAADKRIKPVIGYSPTSVYKTIPNSNVESHVKKIRNRIDTVVKHNYKASVEITAEWNEVETTTPTSVAPLLTSTWNQSPYYNRDCPGLNGDTSVTGCVATAMAQIMYFWKYPNSGRGSYSYLCSPYGTLAANFGATTYSWAAMPNAVKGYGSACNAVALLMNQIGIAVAMQYSPSGSGAYVIPSQTPPGMPCAQTVYVNNFGYDSKINGVSEASYSTAGWDSVLNYDLDHKQPIEYFGFGSDGGHTWVLDGVSKSGLYHMNWGWGGLDNGFFALNDLNPDGIPLGSGDGAVIHIKPGIPPAHCVLPTNLSAASVNNTTETLSWVGDSATSYIVQYQQKGLSAWTQTAPIIGNSVTLPNLYYGTSYNWDIEKYCLNGGYTGFSYPSVSFTTSGTPECIPPAVNSIFTTSNSAPISWNAIIGAKGYALQYQQSGANTWTKIYVTTNSYNITNLPSSATFNFNVRSVCGVGDTSAINTGQTFFATYPPCAVPVGLNVDSTGGGSLDIAGACAKVYCKPVVGATKYNWNFSGVGSPTGTGYVSHTWSSATNVFYISPSPQEVGLCQDNFAVNVSVGCANNGNSISNTIYVTPNTDSVYCQTPSNITVTNLTGTSGNINWKEVSKVSEYWINYNDLNNGTNTLYTSTTPTLPLITTPSSNYNFVIFAFGTTNGMSNPSPIISFTTPAAQAVCSSPSNVVISSITATSVLVAFTGSGSDSVYKIKYKPTVSTVWDSVTTTNTSYQLNNLLSYTPYQTEVQKVCSWNNNSPFTPISTFVTLQIPPVYCTVKGNSTYNYISGITIGSLSNITTNDNGYGDYSSLSTILVPGKIYPITLTATNLLNTDYDEYWSIFIYYNGSWVKLYKGNSTVAIKGSIKIPATYLAGSYRLRIVKHAVITQKAYINNPCQIGTYSDVQDYTVIIGSSVSKLSVR